MTNDLFSLKSFIGGKINEGRYSGLLPCQICNYFDKTDICFLHEIEIQKN